MYFQKASDIEPFIPKPEELISANALHEFQFFSAGINNLNNLLPDAVV